MKHPEFITANEVMEMLDIGRTSAYDLIRRLNNELKEKGFITFRGRTSRKYFCERLGVQ